MTTTFKIDQKKLNDLIDACWAHHAWVREHYSGILPAIEMPILWFGDLEKFFIADRKIITVGLNPSDWEFHTKKGRGKGSPSLHRFFSNGGFPWKNQPTTDGERKAYIDALNNYFKTGNAYNTWFSKWNRILTALDASFNASSDQFQVLHIDCCTPIATNPTWNDLTEEKYGTTRDKILGNAKQFFADLVKFLDPALIIGCVAKNNVNAMTELLGIEKPKRCDETFCNRGKTREVLHSQSSGQGKAVHVYDSPQKNYPWGGWCDLQIENFAKLIRQQVWGETVSFSFYNRKEKSK